MFPRLRAGFARAASRDRLLLPLPILAALTVALVAADPVAADSPAPAAAPEGWRFLESHFAAHPELTTTQSSGFKPFHRWKWLMETRETPSGTSAAAQRMEALQLGRARAAATRGVEPGWFAVGPTHLSGRCLAIDFDPTDPSIVYVGSASGGLWKSTDSGLSWLAITDDLPTLAIGAVCVLATDPNVVIIGTGEGSGAASANLALGPFGAGIFRSTDAGATWSPTNVSFGAAAAHGFGAMEDNPITGVVLAGASNGVYRSTDAGATWAQVQANGNYSDVKWKPGDANRVYVAKGRDPFFNFQLGNGVRVSTDGGLTFAPAGTGQPAGSTIGQTRLGVTAADPSVIYAHYSSSSNFQSIGVYRSTDDGATWSVRTTQNMAASQGWYNLVLAADPNDADGIVTGGTPLFRSTDGGSTFQEKTHPLIPGGNATTPHVDCHRLAYEPGSTSNVWILNDGGAWRSTDDGATWNERRAGLVTYQFYDICVAQSDSVLTLGGTQDNGIPGRTGFDEWFETTLNADGMVCNINPANDTVYGEAQFGNHFKSPNGGQSWSQINTGITGTGFWVTAVDQDPNLGRHLYTTSTAGMFRTTSGGSTWENVAPHTARWIAISPLDGNVVWTVSNGSGVWVTTDDGVTWAQSATIPTTGTETKICADPGHVGGAFVTYGYYATGQPRVRRTTDFGATWTDVSGDFPDIPANTMVVDPDRPDDWYVGADVGVWRSTDGGTTWTPYGTGLANVLISDLEIRRSPRKLTAGTYGRGAWEVDLPPIGVVDAPELALPTANLLLDPPSPNPVRAWADFRFASRAPGEMTLELFDVAGRRLETLAREPRGDAIIRTAVWDSRRVAPGVYFARLSAGGEVVTRKVVVAR
ncbi:MAG: T9SS type A sorting domain-containing protein [bacterium]